MNRKGGGKQKRCTYVYKGCLKVCAVGATLQRLLLMCVRRGPPRRPTGNFACTAHMSPPTN